MEYNEIRVGDIPCLGFLVDSDDYLYVGPRLSARESVRKETGIVIDPESRFFVRCEGDEFVLFEGVEVLEESKEDALIESSIRFCVRGSVRSKEPESFESQEADDVKKAIEKLLLTGFPVEVIKS